MNLIIVESPTKAKTLNRFLGKDFNVEATVGHIKDLPKSPISVDIENNFEPQYALIDKQKKTISNIKKAAKVATKIYLATDPDREGEAISAHVAELLDKNQIKNTQRIEFHEITKEAVLHAIKNPRKIDENLVNAQTARRVLDRLVGYKLSPILWKKVRRGLSAGRVQSVAVRLIVEREREIEAFQKIEYWEIKALFNEGFETLLMKINDKKAEISNEKDANLVFEDLNKSEYKILKINKREARKASNPPFTTSTLTQSAANLFGWGSKKTMSVAQKLYEEGLITYHRTDSLTLSSQALAMAESYIKKEFGNNYHKLRVFKTKSKSAQEAHEAIRVTKLNSKDPEGADMKKLYDLIKKRFLASQMADSIFDNTTLTVEAKGDKVYNLRASGSILKFDGWKKVYNYKTSNDVILPEVSQNQKLNLKKVNMEQKFTQPPARYNEASLIKTLEELGIGRPSTYAPTISTIVARQYVEKDEGRFYPTSIGIAVTDFLVTNFPEELEYNFTAQMEDHLDNVANGSEKWVDVISPFWKGFSKKLESVEKLADRVKIETEKLGEVCPECGKSEKGELVVRTGRFGKFISCSRFPDCKYTAKFEETIDMKCPKCEQGDVILKKTRKGRKFFGCNRYPECDFASWKDPRQENKKKEPNEDDS